MLGVRRKSCVSWPHYDCCVESALLGSCLCMFCDMLVWFVTSRFSHLGSFGSFSLSFCVFRKLACDTRLRFQRLFSSVVRSCLTSRVFNVFVCYFVGVSVKCSWNFGWFVFFFFWRLLSEWLIGVSCQLLHVSLFFQLIVGSEVGCLSCRLLAIVLSQSAIVDWKLDCFSCQLLRVSSFLQFIFSVVNGWFKSWLFQLSIIVFGMY